MATVTGLTAERMAEIEAASIVSGTVIDGHLYLTTYGNDVIDAGIVTGDGGPPGTTDHNLLTNLEDDDHPQYGTYTHVEGVASDTWVIPHTKPGGYPSVVTVDGAGNEIVGAIVYDSTTQLTVTFAVSVSGKAFLT